MHNYLVTTNKTRLANIERICMIDGTVPGWIPETGDFHFDHHKVGGEKIQLLEIPTNISLYDVTTFVTTQVDADACAAAAWIQLLQMELDPADEYQAFVHLSAIAYDCDHLGLPMDESWDPYREFAAKAVAALKEISREYISELGLTSNRKEWTDMEKERYASLAFKRGTEWLIDAACGDRAWPGESGEADAYFKRIEEQRPRVYEKCFTYKGIAVFDQKEFNEYIDPRILVDWARIYADSNVTLTIRSGDKLANKAGNLGGHSYTLGCVPLHEGGSPMYSQNGVWEKLRNLEIGTREKWDLPVPETSWGGRDEVGGSGWNDPAITGYRHVLDCVIVHLASQRNEAELEEIFSEYEKKKKEYWNEAPSKLNPSEQFIWTEGFIAGMFSIYLDENDNVNVRDLKPCPYVNPELISLWSNGARWGIVQEQENA